jgi:hypothetical protein
MMALGKQARHEFEAKYTAEVNYKLLMHIYARVIDDTRSLYH